MKKFLLCACIFFICNHTFSQAKVTTTEYQKVKQPAVEMEVPYPSKTVDKAIEDKLIKMGYKGKESKGYMVFKGVRIAELGPDEYDLYFKTDRKSKKEKDATVVTMMVSTGFDKFITDESSPVINNAKAFLDSQVVMLADYDLEMQVTDQDDIVKKADKKMINLSEEADDLQKKKKKLDKEIEDNLKAQEIQKAEGEKQRGVLSTLKGKRRQQ